MHFKVSAGSERITFNDVVSLDLMFLEGKAVLHVVDLQTRLNAAKFLKAQSVNAVWSAFLQCWSNAYSGPARIIRVDQGSQLTAKRFCEFAEAAGIQIADSGVEGHNALGAGEKYHGILRDIYLKLRAAHPKGDHELLLSCAIRAINCTANEDGLCPALLAFGFQPLVEKLPTTESRAEMVQLARTAMEQIIARKKIRLALSSRVPTVSDQLFDTGKLVWVFREANMGKGKYEGPFEVASHDFGRKLVYIYSRKQDTPVPFPVTSVKPYFSRSQHSGTEGNADEFHMSCIIVSEIVPPDDPRSNSSIFKGARENEIRGLLEKDTFKVVDKASIPVQANKLKARFILTLKDSDTPAEIAKAGYVVQGHADLERNSRETFDDAPTERHSHCPRHSGSQQVGFKDDRPRPGLPAIQGKAPTRNIHH